MKRKRALIFLLCMIFVCIFAGSLAACGSAVEREGVRVIFELEGGSFKSSDRAVSYYFAVPEGGKAYIQPPDVIASDSKTGNNEIIYPDHHIVEWCRTRTGEPGSYVYSDPWDFERDTISYGDEPITLYAHWALNIYYRYVICYLDDAGNRVALNSYSVNAGDPFKDSRNFADKRSGYTALRERNEETGAMEIVYYDKDGNVWDPDFTHPGGDVSTDVDVYVKYMKGEVDYVSTKEEYLKAISNRKGVYLMNDIDLEGTTDVGPFKVSSGKFVDAFYGNGHTVSNFTLVCPSGINDLLHDDDLGDTVYGAALFGELDGAIIENVTFSDVTILVNTNFSRIQKVCIAPIAVSAKNSTLKDVSVSGTIRVTQLPSVNEENLVIKTDAPFCSADEATTTSNVTVNFDFDDQTK